MDVRLPDGTVLQGVPDGATKADIIGKLQLSGYDVSGLIKKESGRMATEGMSTFDKMQAGFGKAFSDIGLGLRQTLGVAGEEEAGERRVRDQALMATGAGRLGNFGGNVAMMAPAMFVPGANTYAMSGVIGAGIGLLQPVAPGESWELNTGVGGAAGLAGQAIGNTVGRLIRPVTSSLPKQQAALASEAQRRGIPLTAGQATGSRPLQVAEAAMENLPFTSGPQLALKQSQKTAFNRAVGATFGATDDAITPEVAGAARSRIGSQFTELAGRNKLKISGDLVRRLGEIRGNAASFETDDVARVVVNRIDDFLSKVDDSLTVPGTAYRKLDSALGRTMRSTSNGDLRHAVGEIRSAVREAMDASISSADQAAWRTARQEYANLMTVAPLAARSETGDISGRTLLSAAMNANKNARFGGPSELATLGRVGRAFVSDNIPNSGTAQRQFMQSLMTGGGGAGLGAGAAAVTGNDPIQGAMVGGGLTMGGLLAPRAIQAMMNSPAGQAYLTQGLIALTPAQRAAISAATRSGLIGYAAQQ